MTDDFKECPPNTVGYIVREEDTFFQLTQRFETTVPALIGANPGVDPDNLQVGQRICLPLQERFPSCPNGNYYQIRPGDTLYEIAEKFNISVADLEEANPRLEPNNLSIGEIICVPVAVPPVECPENAVPYEVRGGDSFYSIARKFGVTVDSLIEINSEVNPEAILVGQIICVPESE
ncbi:MAG: LysM peptidoglycan-binding domain-containing protein [Bacillota bacterium]